VGHKKLPCGADRATGRCSAMPADCTRRATTTTNHGPSLPLFERTGNLPKALSVSTASPRRLRCGEEPTTGSSCVMVGLPFSDRFSSFSLLILLFFFRSIACGLYMKLHNAHRPLSMKTDVIKKRNRASESDKPRKKRAHSPDSEEEIVTTTTSKQNGYRVALQGPSSTNNFSSVVSPLVRGQPAVPTAPQILVPANLAPPSINISRGLPNDFRS